MSCNCATNEEIQKLYKMYSSEKVKKDDKLITRIKHYFNVVFVNLIVLFICPFLVIYVLYKKFFGNNLISLSKFFRLKQNDISNGEGIQN